MRFRRLVVTEQSQKPPKGFPGANCDLAANCWPLRPWCRSALSRPGGIKAQCRPAQGFNTAAAAAAAGGAPDDDKRRSRRRIRRTTIAVMIARMTMISAMIVLTVMMKTTRNEERDINSSST